MQVEPNQAYFIQEPMITQNQETELEAAIVQIENGVQATEDILYDETVIVNIEPALQVEPDHQQLNFIQESMICENQQMVLARFSDDHVIGIISG
jgi:hypothetical protein